MWPPVDVKPVWHRQLVPTSFLATLEQGSELPSTVFAANFGCVVLVSSSSYLPGNEELRAARRFQPDWTTTVFLTAYCAFLAGLAALEYANFPAWSIYTGRPTHVTLRLTSEVSVCATLVHHGWHTVSFASWSKRCSFEWVFCWQVSTTVVR